MKENKCGLSQQARFNDKNWRLHAAACTECAEVLRVGDWMVSLAASTAVPALPAAGFIMVKARIRERLASARRANRPIQVMTAFAGAILMVSAVLLFSSQTYVASTMANAVSMIASFAGVVLIGTFLAAAVCAAAAYLMNENGRRPGTN